MATPADLAGPTLAWRVARRRVVLRQYAKLSGSGLPVTCWKAHKLVYESQEVARACAQALVELDCEYQRPYECHEEKKSHWHLTSTWHPATD